MNKPTACPDCLRRSWLLNLLSAYIERVEPDRVGQLLALSNTALAEEVAPRVAGQLLARVAGTTEQQMREELAVASCWAVCRCSDDYPAQLRDLGDAAPWALIGRGDFQLLAGLKARSAISVVGARRATSYGREIARSLGGDLAGAGMTVISGLAFGIDACAHRGALDAAGGRTIAVLGCGPDNAYPVAHRALWRRIAEEGGLVLAELQPGASPWRWTFSARNRIMAALAGMTVVVEAAQGSGSLGTANIASTIGRSLGAVPGPTTSRASSGPNNLISLGAHLVRSIEDVRNAMASDEQAIDWAKLAGQRLGVIHNMADQIAGFEDATRHMRTRLAGERRRDHALTQIRDIAKDGTFGNLEDEAVEAAFKRIVTIAEAQKPGEDWRAVTEDRVSDLRRDEENQATLDAARSRGASELIADADTAAELAEAAGAEIIPPENIVQGSAADDDKHGDGFCPDCGSANIAAQTASDEVTPWACLNCDSQFEDPEKPMYAMVIVVEGDSAEQAWNGVAKLLEGDDRTRYVGAPWASIPPATNEFTTNLIRLGMTIPCEQAREPGEFDHVTRDLTPCG